MSWLRNKGAMGRSFNAEFFALLLQCPSCHAPSRNTLSVCSQTNHVGTSKGKECSKVQTVHPNKDRQAALKSVCDGGHKPPALRLALAKFVDD
jgi:hypothetical protein